MSAAPARLSSAIPAGQKCDPDTLAYQRFLGACRRFWTEPMFRALQRQIEEAVAGGLIRPDDAAGFEVFVQRHPTHQIFAWLERHLQRLKYSGRWGLVVALEAQRDALLAELAKPLPAGLLTLDPDLDPPDYYGDYDIHQHPAGWAAIRSPASSIARLPAKPAASSASPGCTIGSQS